MLALYKLSAKTVPKPSTSLDEPLPSVIDWFSLSVFPGSAALPGTPGKTGSAGRALSPLPSPLRVGAIACCVPGALPSGKDPSGHQPLAGKRAESAGSIPSPLRPRSGNIQAPCPDIPQPQNSKSKRKKEENQSGVLSRSQAGLRNQKPECCYGKRAVSPEGSWVCPRGGTPRPPAMSPSPAAMRKRALRDGTRRSEG